MCVPILIDGVHHLMMHYFESLSNCGLIRFILIQSVFEEHNILKRKIELPFR